MHFKWIHKSDNDNLILFMNGWGMNESVISHLAFDGYDLIMCHNYGSEVVGLPTIRPSAKITIIAWSMGVWASSHIPESIKQRTHYRMAINGTPTPANEQTGIAPETIKGTIDQWSHIKQQKFYRRMCINKAEYDALYEKLPIGNIDEQKRELAFILEHASTDSETSLWNKAIIGENDSIFNTTNQKNYWPSHITKTIAKMAHYPFNNFSSWQQIIDL